MRRILILLAAWWLAASGAAAQGADPSLPRAQIEQLIAESGAEGVFEVVEDGKVRHLGSGLVCRFYTGQTNRLHLYEGSARGEDIGCDSAREDQYMTLYATRYPPPVSLEERLAGAEAAIRQRFSDAHPLNPRISMESERLPPRLVRNFLVTVNGARWFTSVTMAQREEWTLKLRYTAPVPDDRAILRAELEAQSFFTLALLGANPTAPAAQEGAGASPPQR